MTGTASGLAARTRSAAGDDFLRLNFLPRDDRDLGEEAGAGSARSDRYRLLRNALVTFLFLLFWRDPNRWVAYSRDRNAYMALRRYSCRLMSYQSMMWAVNTLEEAGLVEHRRARPSSNGRYRSTLRATEKLTSKSLITHVSQVSCVLGETIRLRDCDKELLVYRDTTEIRSWRDDVKEQNEASLALRVSLSSPQWHTDIHGLLRQGDRVVNPAFDQYYRVWNCDFRHGGRWYCPFVQGLPSQDRSYLLIDDKPTIEIDYRHLHPTLLAAIANCDLGGEDPYVIAGIKRGQVKLAFNILLNAETERSAILAIQQEFAESRHPSPARSARQVVDAIKLRHPKFAFAWGTGIGLRLQNIDATMCARVQRLMRQQGHPVLSVHDSFVVEEVQRHLLEDVMNDVLEEMSKALRAHGL